MQFRAVLIPLEGGSPIEIDKEMVVVGRKEHCDLPLEHKSVSKVHCVLVKTDGLLVLRDLGSTNGTRVNGTRVRRAALLPNDKVSFANCHFRVFLGPPDMPASSSEMTMQFGANGDFFFEPEEPEGVRVHVNELPDVYPEKKGKKEKALDDSERVEG